MIDLIGYWYALSFMVLPIPLWAVYLMLAHVYEKTKAQLIDQNVCYSYDVDEHMPKLLLLPDKMEKFFWSYWIVWLNGILSTIVSIMLALASVVYIGSEGYKGMDSIVNDFSVIAKATAPFAGWSLVISCVAMLVLNAGEWYAKSYVAYLRVVKKVSKW